LTDLKDGRFGCLFVVGTAAFVTAVSQINFRGQNIHLDPEGTPHVSIFRQWLYDIMYGREPSDWVEVIEEEEQIECGL